jgi:phage gp29-like protein
MPNATTNKHALPTTLPLKRSIKDLLESNFQFGQVFHGFSKLLPNPDPVLKKMGIGYDVDIYKKLLTDPQLYGVIENNRKPGVTSLERYIDNPKCNEVELEFIKSLFDKYIRDGLYANITNLTLDTPQFGRTVFALRWGFYKDYFVPIDITLVPYEYAKFNVPGELMICNEQGSFELADNPARYIVLQHKATATNPYGEAILSNCYWNVIFKKEVAKFWIAFSEKYGMPYAVGKYNPALLAASFNVTGEEAATLFLNKINDMCQDGVIVIPEGTELNFQNIAKADNSAIFENIYRICDEQNTKLQLGHSGASESTSGDKLSNDTTVTDVRKDIVDSDKQYPIMFWNKLIKLVHSFNFNGEEMPIYDLYAREEVDMEQAQRDAILVPVLQNAGYKVSKEYLQKMYGFEEEDLAEADNYYEDSYSAPAKKEADKSKETTKEKDTEEEDIEKTSDKLEDEEEGVKEDAKAVRQIKIYAQNIANKLLMKNEDTEDQLAIDELTDKAFDNDIFNQSIVSFIADKLTKYDTLNEMKKQLPKMLKDIDTKEFEEYLTNILFTAELIGKFSEIEDDEYEK